MAEYDYRELAYDLYRNADELLDSLVDMRRKRGLTQKRLADRMNVTQGYVSQIENGRTSLTSLLTDYALEVGARVEYRVEPAEDKPEGARRYYRLEMDFKGVPVGEEWRTGEVDMTSADVHVSVDARTGADGETPQQLTFMTLGRMGRVDDAAPVGDDACPVSDTAELEISR